MGHIVSRVVLIGGPAGSGKSTFAAALCEKSGALFLEADQFPDDGIDVLDLRAEWEDYWERLNAKPLVQILAHRSFAAGFRGAVLSLPSNAIIDVRRLRVAADAGMRTVITFGTPAACLDAFLDREARTGRNLGEGHWRQFNLSACSIYAGPEYTAARLETFSGSGTRRSLANLVAEFERGAHDG